MNGMISFEVFVAALVTILTTGSVSAVTFYINAKKSNNDRDKTYDSHGFKMLLAIMIILILGMTVLYFSDKLFSYILKINPLRFFPFYSELFSNSRFKTLYIIDSILSLLTIIFLIWWFCDEMPIVKWYGYILEPFCTILLGYGLIWLNFFASDLYITYIQFEADFFFFSLFLAYSVIIYLVVFILVVCLADTITTWVT